MYISFALGLIGNAKQSKCLVEYRLICFLCVQSTQDDLDTERETYQSSRTGLDSMYIDTQKKLQEETQMRLVSTTTHSPTGVVIEWTSPPVCIPINILKIGKRPGWGLLT